MTARARAALLILTLAGWGLAGAAEPDAADDVDECKVLSALDFNEAVGAKVTLTAALVPAASGLPARCRVTGTIAPEVGVEAWLPTDHWNDRLLVTGCYGLCGSIRADQMEDAAARGYATATTDGGHSDQKYPDGRWAYNNTELENDFGHRAVHVTAVLAKALIEAYYGSHEEHAYFRGCSTGGRQALVAAGRYPDDFEGVIAGAPFNPLLSVPHMIWVDRANTGADGRPILGKPQFELLHKAALAECDQLDGLADGIIGDPPSCAFTPQSLACAPGQAGACLDPQQVAAAQMIYQGPANGAGQRLAAFGPFGAAAGSEFTWEQQLIGRDGKPAFFHVVGQDWMRYHAFEPDPPADSGPLVFDFDKDPPRLAAGAARAAFTPGLERFSARDGKLILYHGWADEALQPAHTLAYWQQLLAANGSAEGLNRFARLFLLPGVQHCGGGPGAGDVDYLAALERWVEDDEAPDVLIAWRTKESVSATVRQARFPVTGEVQMKRPVFPYPDVARYGGKGDALDPKSYERVKPGAEGEKPRP